MGILDELTYAALQKFQADTKTIPDGLLGLVTIANLFPDAQPTDASAKAMLTDFETRSRSLEEKKPIVHEMAGILKRPCRKLRGEVLRLGRSGDHTALVMITHEGVDRHEVEDVLHRRWTNAIVKSLEREEPTVAMLAGEAADLGRCRRGIEPLRIVIMPEQTTYDHLACHRAYASDCLIAVDGAGLPDRVDHPDR